MIEGEIKMNVSEQIINVINALCEKFGIAVDWTADNILPYLETLCAKFVNFEIWTSVFWMAFWFILACGCWIPVKPFCRKAKEDRWDFDYGWPWGAMWNIIIASILSFVAIIVIGIQVYDIIEVTIFPEKTIYDYITYQINMMSNR